MSLCGVAVLHVTFFVELLDVLHPFYEFGRPTHRTVWQKVEKYSVKYYSNLFIFFLTSLIFSLLMEKTPQYFTFFTYRPGNLIISHSNNFNQSSQKMKNFPIISFALWTNMENLFKKSLHDYFKDKKLEIFSSYPWGTFF